MASRRDLPLEICSARTSRPLARRTGTRAPRSSVARTSPRSTPSGRPPRGQDRFTARRSRSSARTRALAAPNVTGRGRSPEASRSATSRTTSGASNSAPPRSSSGSRNRAAIALSPGWCAASPQAESGWAAQPASAPRGIREGPSWHRTPASSSCPADTLVPESQTCSVFRQAIPRRRPRQGGTAQAAVRQPPPPQRQAAEGLSFPLFP